MINLKLAGQYEENIQIEKNNKVLVINYNKYIEFYKYFYERANVFLENKEITKKDCIFIDVTSVGAIIKELEFKKNSLLYDYMQIKYNEMDIIEKDKFYDAFLKQIDFLKNNINLEFDIIPEDTIDKVVMQNIDVGINYTNLIDEFKKILHFVLSYNFNKTFIVFYNSRFLEIDKELTNCYTFDFNSYLDAKEYNILITEEINELNYDFLIDYLKNIWPIEYYDDEIENLVNDYFRYGILSAKFVTRREKLYLLSVILNKKYNLNQEILCDKTIFDSIIKSFIDNI